MFELILMVFKSQFVFFALPNGNCLFYCFFFFFWHRDGMFLISKRPSICFSRLLSLSLSLRLLLKKVTFKSLSLRLQVAVHRQFKAKSKDRGTVLL
jgi:hypothetical protein